MNAGVAQATQFRDRSLAALILLLNPRGFEPHPGLRRTIRAAPGRASSLANDIAGAADLDCALRKLRRLKARRRTAARAEATFSPSRRESLRSCATGRENPGACRWGLS